jgi:ferrochelatase
MSDVTTPTGALLVNLGTPDSPEPADVRRYLAEFLSDPRVLTMPAPLRWLLLHGVILRIRPKKSAHAYAQIWQPEGSPLLIHGRTLCAAVEKTLRPAGIHVELAMRYGRPEVGSALGRLVGAGARRIVVLPLFPQYSEAATGSALAHVRREASGLGTPVDLVEITSFHSEPGFIEAAVAAARPLIDGIRAEHVLLSFHGLPESQIRANPGCLVQATCCDSPGPSFSRCYRAQCHATSRALISALALEPDRCTIAFQSRVGLNKWIGPYTDEVLTELRARGVDRLAVVCPAFVADCLETLEEIDLRLRARWLALGGREFALAPCVNTEPAWVDAVAHMIRRAAESARS